MCRSTGELAASTCAKRVKSRGEAGLLRMATAIRGMPGSEFEPRRPLQKRRDTRMGVSSFLERHFCCAKVIACGRMIEREWGNPQRFPPHTPPSLRWAGVRTTKPVGNHKKKHHPSGWCFLFGMSRAGLNLLPRPARSASNQEVRQGSCEWRQPFVGCREASSSLVARSINHHPFGW